MEPAKTKIRYVVFSEVRALHEDAGGGWFAHFRGSSEAIYMGEEKPFDIGDRVKITFEKVEHAQPIQPSE